MMKFVECASVCDGILAFAGSALSTLDVSLAVWARVAGLRITQRPRHIVQASCRQLGPFSVQRPVLAIIEPHSMGEWVRDVPPPYEAGVRILKEPAE